MNEDDSNRDADVIMGESQSRQDTDQAANPENDADLDVRIILSERVDFLVHIDVLTKSSRLFQACAEEWREDPFPSFQLQGSNPDEFSVYLDWLRNGRIASQGERDEYARLCALIILSFQLDDSEFRTALFVAMREKAAEITENAERCLPSRTFIDFVFSKEEWVVDGRDVGGPLRGVIAELFARYVNGPDFKRRSGWYHPRFVEAVKREKMEMEMRNIEQQKRVMREALGWRGRGGRDR